MPDDDIIKHHGEGVKYFWKLKKGKKPTYEKMEEAIEGPPEAPPKPEPEKKLKEKSTKGSLPFSESEIRKGYRKL